MESEIKPAPATPSAKAKSANWRRGNAQYTLEELRQRNQQFERAWSPTKKRQGGDPV